jgi:hypothetical protein
MVMRLSTDFSFSISRSDGRELWQAGGKIREQRRLTDNFKFVVSRGILLESARRQQG